MAQLTRRNFVQVAGMTAAPDASAYPIEPDGEGV